MGSQREKSAPEGRRRRSSGIQGLYRAAMLALAVTAIVRELRLPAEERTWHGRVARVVPYDFRRPTLDRFRERVWNPDGPHLVGPRVFGVGWTVNLGRAMRLVRERTGRA